MSICNKLVEIVFGSFVLGTDVVSSNDQVRCGISLESQLCDNTKCATTTTANSPIQILVLTLIGDQDLTGWSDNLCLENVISSLAVFACCKAMTTSGSPANNSDIL